MLDFLLKCNKSSSLTTNTQHYQSSASSGKRVYGLTLADQAVENEGFNNTRNVDAARYDNDG